MKLCLTCKVLREDPYLNRRLIRDNLFFFFFPGGSDGKEPACNAGDPALNPGSGISPREGNGYPIVSLQSLPGESHGQRSLVGYSPWGRKESDMTEQLTLSLSVLTHLLSFFPFIFISWRLITLQYCSGFCHTVTWISHGFTCVPHPDSPLPPPSLPDPSGSSQGASPKHLSHASSLGWWAVSPLIIYMFQCCSLETSHPRLLPQSPKVCSVYLCVLGDVAEDSLSSLLLFTSGIILTDS